MNVTFRLADGTQAGIVPTRELRELAKQRLGVEWTAPGRKLPVVFHVRDRQALDRVITRFGVHRAC
ncbi:MAG: hypothetical protein ACOYXU_06575 [Nitrospirota bacterium]